MVEYKVLITTSGLGSRLGNLTKFSNKSLVRVGDKAIISHIIDCYPKNTKFIITLGYKGSEVEQYVRMAHSNEHIEFVRVDNFSGEGSSLLYSISKCKEHLQTPFIFHACDTLVEKNYLDLLDDRTNWCVGGSGKSSQSYRTINSINKFVSTINEKGEQNFDHVYVGICGIKDFSLFWKIADRITLSQKSQELSDCHVINEMLLESKFSVLEVSDWFDVGNIDALRITREKIPSSIHVLDKEDENIFIFDEFVIKQFSDKTICKNRVLRANVLKGLIPDIIDNSENFYKYRYARGDLLADVVDIKKFKELLEWSKTSIWTPKEDPKFKLNCLSFYKDKTAKRVSKFLEKYNIKDTPNRINGIDVPTIQELIEQIDFDSICGKTPTGFHGDFILDNIIYNDIGKFTLIDWRQEFNGNLESGDMYYDLAKLNHNLILNHNILANKQFKIEISKNRINCDIFVKKALLDCKEELERYCIINQICYQDIQISTSLIWINMSPLHENPLDKFLFYFGKYNLFLHLQRKSFYDKKTH